MPFPKNSKEQDYAVNSSTNVAPPWQDANPATKPVKIATLILILIRYQFLQSSLCISPLDSKSNKGYPPETSYPRIRKDANE
ncbi:hypothetical protein pdam_00003068 [Pocillopora damicornis]|uniref:Uncharacterized protein n=1 Tax=Pocillopora damicornis TaxID=46731 RepID=A0A3M6T9L1_POCDA|nr:hypothetical protein pdam_00003068 [Pocillopora damicornis]